MNIRPCKIAEILEAPNFDALVDEYADESSIDGLPRPKAKVELYMALEATGLTRSFGAFDGDVLCGFVVVLAPVLPHYGATVCTTESLFVAKSHRSSGAGLSLLREAEKIAKELGSPGLLVSAPFGGVLAQVLPRSGYRQTNAVFFKNV